MPARISRQFLSDDSLNRSVRAMSAQLMVMGSLIHRFRDEPEVEHVLRQDDNALSDVLGILLYEQRMRRIEDEVERTSEPPPD